MRKIINSLPLTKDSNQFFILIFIILYLFYDLIHLKSIPVGPDVGVFLTNARDLVQYGRIPGVDTFGIYTPLGYLFYAIPFVIFSEPDIYWFYILNLFLFLISTLIALRIFNVLFKNKIFILFAILSFIYSFHGIVYDVKLENLVLFLNLLIIKLLLTKANESSYQKTIIIGFLTALTFLTKQYGGLSLIYSILYIIYSNNKSKTIKQIFLIITTFCVTILLFLFNQMFNGVDFIDAINQLKGDFGFECTGVNSGGIGIYGEKDFLNLIKSLKYHKLNVLLIISAILFIVKIVYFKTKNTNNTKEVLILLTCYLLMGIPFYFQMFPHYIMFGLPFVLFFQLKLISDFVNNNYFKLVQYTLYINYVAVIFISSYTIWVQRKTINKLEIKKETDQLFYNHVNALIPKKSCVFVLNNRQLWFSAAFVTPVPKTMGYSWAGISCLKEAIKIEKPENFWISNIEELTDNCYFEGYVKTKNVSLVENERKFYAVHFDKR